MSDHPKFMEIKREQDKAVLLLRGDWTIENAAPIEQEIEHAAQELDHRPYDVVADRIDRLDTSGAFLLKKLTAAEASPPRLSPALQPVLGSMPQWNPASTRPSGPCGGSAFAGG